MEYAHEPSFRVTAKNHAAEPVYFLQMADVPGNEEDRSRSALLEGEFLVGEGRISGRLANARSERRHLSGLLGTRRENDS